MEDATPGRPARARISPWPGCDDVAQLALVDHQMVPAAADVDGWIGDAARTGARVVRTNALFPAAASVFERAGFETASELALLQLTLTGPRGGTRVGVGDVAVADSPPDRTRTRRMRQRDLAVVSAIDETSFPDSWTNDERSLEEIRRATPYHRSRVTVGPRGEITAFAISGRAATTGYVQRLAVLPSARRRGLARTLVVDAVAWMRRRGCGTALVNTAVGNDAAIALYRSLGFHSLDHRLRIMQRAVPA